MLCVTNMLLHGIKDPSFVRHDNTLARPIWLPNGTLDNQLRYAKHDRSIELVVGSPEPVGPASAGETHETGESLANAFHRVHGTTYDPASAEDREKMAALKEKLRS